MPVTVVTLSKVEAQPTQVKVSWTSDQQTTALAECYASATLDGLANPNSRARQKAGTPVYPQIPGSSFFTVLFPQFAPFLIPDTIYYVRANCDGVLSDIRGFYTPPKRLPPSPVLLRMGAKFRPFTRPGWGTYDSTGKFVQIQGAQFTALASIQPDESLREVLKLPEGQRSRQLVKVYSDTRLVEASQQTGQKGDRFEYNGRLYEVQRSGTWRDAGTPAARLNHWKSMAWTVEQDTE